MSPLEPLTPDQRAVISLVLSQGRSYDDIAALLGISVDAVRARAHAGLAALAPGDGLPGEITGPLADYLLGQQPAGDAEATRGLLAESAPARDWATSVADRLGDAAPNGLPEVPGAEPVVAEPASADPPPATAADAAAPSADAAPPPADPAPPPPADGGGPPPAAENAAAAPDGGPPPASKLGGALLILAAVAAVAVVLVLVLRGSDDEEPARTGAAAPTATPAATATATPQVTDQIELRAPGGGKARGAMTVFLQDGKLGFALQATRVPSNTSGNAYAVWFTGPGDKAVRLGFTNAVGADGRLGIQGPSKQGAAAFPRQYAGYSTVVVSRETTQATSRPADVVLRGSLPKGR